MHTTWTHHNVDIKILTKRSLDKADVDAKSTHGCREVPMEEVEAAARLANAHQFILSFRQTVQYQ